MKKNLTVLLALLVATLLLGCPDSYRVKKLAKIDVTGAKSLFVAPSGAVTRGAESLNALYKMDDEGVPKEVPFTDSDGKTVSLGSTDVEYVTNVNNEFVLVGYRDHSNSRAGRDSLAVFLTRKKDGAVFSLEKAGFPDGGKTVHGNNSIFYGVDIPNSSDNGFVRLNLKTMEAKEIELAEDKRGNALEPIFADSRDNCIYGKDAHKRLIKSTGGYLNLPSEPSFMAFDEFFFKSNSPVEETKSLSIDENGNEIWTTYSKKTKHGEPHWSLWFSYLKKCKVLSYDNKTYVCVFRSGDNDIYQIDNSDKTIALALSFKFIEDLIQTSYNGEDFFILGTDKDKKPKFIKIAMKDFSIEEFDISKYDMKSFVANKGYISFSGNEFSTANRIVANMDLETKEVKVIQRDSDTQKVIKLERIW